MTYKQTLIVLFLFFSVVISLPQPKPNPKSPPKKPSPNPLAGQWVITSCIRNPLSVNVRFDNDDIHFKYGSDKVLVYKANGNSIKFTPRKTARKPNNLNKPTEIQVDNAFAAVTTYQLKNNDLLLKDALNQVIVTLTKASHHKKQINKSPVPIQHRK